MSPDPHRIFHSFSKRRVDNLRQHLDQSFRCQKLGAKRLKALERVKGIEPSYSAWKAAALPLSYTRAGDGLSRHGHGLNCPAPT